uniref:RRM domain-containing protein n=1 Tax=Oryza barthii TaxID=65489 RepID=A0A0D3F1J8_9ORYZ
MIDTLYVAYFYPGMFHLFCRRHLGKSRTKRLVQLQYSYGCLSSHYGFLVKHYLAVQKEEERPKEKERRKPRVIDEFMEELKFEKELRQKRNQEREQWREGRHTDTSASSSRFDELPDELDPIGKLPGSFDDGDPQTTNLYVGNLSPKVDENFLMRTFGRFGPIASVKIMWPRTEEERRRQRNCGFVAFMNRADGQAAKDEMEGVVVYDYELKLGWGKSVALPSQALPAPPPGHMAIRNKEDGFRLNEDGALATGKAAATRELLGLPLAELERRCRHNGLSLCGGKEMMVARLLSLEEAEKERVYEKDAGIKYGQGESHRTGRDDIAVNARNASRPGEGTDSGESDMLGLSHYAMEAGHKRSNESTPAEPVPSKKPKVDPVLPASKWSREDDVSDDEDRKGGRGLGLSYSSGSDIAGDSGKADATEVSTDHSNHHQDTILDEEHRKKLRQIEIAVMQYRESLEEKGLRNTEEIEKKVASHRRRLQSEYGLSFSNDGANNRRSSERTSSERRDRHDDSSRKRRRSLSRSRSPPRRSLERDREHNRNRDTDRSHGNDAGRERDRVREKSASRGRDDHYDRSRDREKDRRKGR